MEKASELVGDFVLRGFEKFEGECAQHGKSEVHLPSFLKSKKWFCRECNEIEIKAKAEREWLQNRQETLHRIAEIPFKYRGAKFDAKTKEQKAVRLTVKAFRDVITTEDRWAVLVFMGGVGTGKTLLASEFGESLINNQAMSVRYCTAKQMISEIQAAYNTEGKTEESEILRFVQYDLLILDEIDAKPDRENANILLTEVVNRRYNAEMPMVVITNQPFDNLARFVGDRVDDRLHENAFVCAFDWPSFRRLQSN